MTDIIEEMKENRNQEEEHDHIHFLQLVNLSVEDRAIQIINRNPMYFDEYKKWWCFNKESKKWVSVDEIDIIGFIKKSFKLYGLSSSGLRTELLNALKDEARSRKPKKLEDYKIQIGKCIYDIRNDEVILSDHKYLPNIIIDHDIAGVSDDEECTQINKIFDQWVGDKKDVLYDILSFCMSPRYFLDIVFWFVGNGENGKGLFTTVINNVVGIENTTSQDLELLSDPKDRFTKGFLKNKLICLLGDGNSNSINNTKSLKTLSGCTDRVRSEMKGGGQDDFYNRAKLVGAFNTLPETLDKTKGFYRRQHITEFKNDFTGMKNPLPSIPEREYTILAKKCFLNLKKIYKTNVIKGWGTIDERKDRYERLSNPVGLFISENMYRDDNGYFFGKTIYKYYKAYAINKGYTDFRYNEFEARLLNQGFEKKRKDVYHVDGFCWGKFKDSLENYKEKDINYDKFTVFNGLSFNNLKKIDEIDRIDAFFELKIPYKETELKKGCFASISSKNGVFSTFLGDFRRIDRILLPCSQCESVDEMITLENMKNGTFWCDICAGVNN